MQLRDLGEFALIERIAAAARRAGQGSPAGVVVGIGDDAAVLRPRAGEDVVVSTDALVEDVHFRWRSWAPKTLGRRALVANLSDLAAMGARPLGFTLALAAPPRLDVSLLDRVVAGLLAQAARSACPLVGGNVARARKTSLTLAILGAVERGRALTRAGVQAGDRLCVTGALGASALELWRSERGGPRVRRVPEPRVEAGRRLARVPGVGGCLDVSDGLGADLSHLLGARLRAEIDPARLPRPRGFDAACRRAGADPERLLLGGGEDYELLFSLRPGAPPAGKLAARLGVPVTEIGRAVARGPRERPPAGGWRHF